MTQASGLKLAKQFQSVLGLLNIHFATTVALSASSLNNFYIWNHSHFSPYSEFAQLVHSSPDT